MNPPLRWVLADVDGTLTDGGIYYSPRGEELKKFNTRDGMGVARLRQAGLKIGFITQEKSPIVERRAEKLRLDACLCGVEDKVEAAEELLRREGLPLSALAFIGDDLNDLPLLRRAGISAAPADAQPEVAGAVQFRCRKNGGDGAFREFAEHLLTLFPATPPRR